MTEKKLRQLLNVWKTRLGLDHYKINLVFGRCEDEYSYMEVQRSINYQRAKITVQPWMLGQGDPPKDLLQEINDEMIEESLVHELLHICTRDLTAIVRNDLDGMVHRDVYSMFENATCRADERVVDSLAVALCQAFRKEK